jgi:hypothetical protein
MYLAGNFVSCHSLLALVFMLCSICTASPGSRENRPIARARTLHKIESPTVDQTRSLADSFGRCSHFRTPVRTSQRSRGIGCHRAPSDGGFTCGQWRWVTDGALGTRPDDIQQLWRSSYVRDDVAPCPSRPHLSSLHVSDLVQDFRSAGDRHGAILCDPKLSAGLGERTRRRHCPPSSDPKR